MTRDIIIEMQKRAGVPAEQQGKNHQDLWHAFCSIIDEAAEMGGVQLAISIRDFLYEKLSPVSYVIANMRDDDNRIAAEQAAEERQSLIARH